MQVWDLRKQKCLQKYKQGCPVTTSVFTPDGRSLVSGSTDGSISVWDLTAGKRLTKLTNHKQPINALCFHPSDIVLAVASQVCDASTQTAAVPHHHGTLAYPTTKSDILPLCMIPTLVLLKQDLKVHPRPPTAATMWSGSCVLHSVSAVHHMPVCTVHTTPQTVLCRTYCPPQIAHCAHHMA